MIKNQFIKVIHEFMIDAGGEFKSKDLRTFLKELGINILPVFRTCTNKMVMLKGSYEP
jgi:hypothetical protein